MVFMKLYNIARGCAQDFGENKIVGAIKLTCCLLISFKEVSDREAFINVCGMFQTWISLTIILYSLMSIIHNQTMWDIVLENVVDPIWAKINKLHNEVMARYEKRDADELAANAATPQNKKEEPARARKSPRAGSRKSDRIAGHV